MTRQSDEATLRFRCAACGGLFRVPEHPGSHREDERRWTRIGGRIYCEPCARERHHRTRNIDGLLGPTTIQQNQTI